MNKLKGNVAVGLMVLLGVAMASSVVYNSQRAKDSRHITKASQLAGTEEGRSLQTLDNAAHNWLDDDYNRARVWEFDTRYEIPIDELIEKRLLPNGFADRYSEVGQSVYGLPYTTSVIKRLVPGGDDEFNVLTTIGTRGTPPPEVPPMLCVTVFDFQRNGSSMIGGFKTISTSDRNMPWNGSCVDSPAFLPGNSNPWVYLDDWLVSNWNLVDPKPTPITPIASQFNCSLVTSNGDSEWSLAQGFASPRPIENFIKCIWTDNPPVGGSCPARFTWRDSSGNPHVITPGIMYWNNLFMKSYSGSCSESVRIAAENDIRNNNGLTRSTAGLPFDTGTYSCTNNSTYINCLLTDPGSGGGNSDHCDVYAYNDATGNFDYINAHNGTNCYGVL